MAIELEWYCTASQRQHPHRQPLTTTLVHIEGVNQNRVQFVDVIKLVELDVFDQLHGYNGGCDTGGIGAQVLCRWMSDDPSERMR